MNNEKSEKQRVDPLYTVGYIVLVAFVRLFYGLRIVGRENIPDGAALICANHSNSLDPVYLCAAVDRSQQVHMMVKRRRTFSLYRYRRGIRKAKPRKARRPSPTENTGRKRSTRASRKTKTEPRIPMVLPREYFLWQQRSQIMELKTSISIRERN